MSEQVQALVIIVIYVVAVVLALSLIIVHESRKDPYRLPYWERKARRYERKADRLTKFGTALALFPVFETTIHNSFIVAKHYRELAEACRNQEFLGK